MSTLVESLQEALSTSQVTTNLTARELHSKDESYHAPVTPEIVVYPNNAQDVSEIMQIAKKFNRSVYPFGLGSSLEGLVIPTEDGISIDFSEMNRIIEVKEQDLPWRHAHPVKQRTQKIRTLLFR